VVKALYAGNQQTMMRESMGIVTETSGGVFLRRCVKQLFARPRVCFSLDVRHVYVAVDPCGGGDSKFAICSVYRDNASVVVPFPHPFPKNVTHCVQIVGLDDAKITGHTDMNATLLRHIRGLERLVGGATHAVRFVIMTESNLGLEAAHVANMLKDEPRCIQLKETGPQGRYGVLTTHQRKIEFVALLESMLTQDGICIVDNLVSTDATTTLATLQRQLGQYRMISTTGAGLFAPPKISYSGKVGPDGKLSTLQDDLCIALQMAVYWSSYVIQRKCKFLDYAGLF
jgi:hypothetical protein